jgi:hypothetical protein
MTPAQKAAATRKRRAAAAKAVTTKKRRSAGAKAAQTRKRKAAGRKAAETRREKAAAKESVSAIKENGCRYTEDDVFCYINTDLDLTSADDLTLLAAAFEAKEVSPLHVTRGEDGLWYTIFEVYDQHEEPEKAISTMLAVIESLEGSLKTVWAGCTRREFNIGYDCGSKPWAFNQGLSSQLLGRIAAVGASLRLTLYPPAREKNA